MKILITLMVLSIAPSVFAQGSSKLACVSTQGVSFTSNNGLAEIQFTSTSKDGSLVTKKEEAEVENYGSYNDSSITQVKWMGNAVILSETTDNSCNRDYVTTTFKNKAEIIRVGQVKRIIVDVVCTEDLITSSGAEVDECLY